MKKTFYITIVFILGFLCFESTAMIANPIISRGKSVYVSPSGSSAAYLVDNAFGNTSFIISNNSWIAINLGTAYNQVFFTWNNPNYTWSDVVAASGSCKQNPVIPANYTIQASSNSTNGSDGTWTTLTTVTGNNVTARGHSVNLNGAKWLRMNISSGGGPIDEIEVFDLANGGNDLWFFPGTSISANTYKQTPVPTKNYADLIKQASPTFTPSMIRGGIPCINSTQFKNDIQLYMNMAGNVKYWAIEMGTNDGYNNENSNVATFKSNLQSIITTCKNAGIQPIIARVIGTNQSAAGWQIHADYMKAVDDLTTQNSLIAGPDLYTWFTTHTNELNSDGIHPNATGAASIQRLWAEKMTSLYITTSISDHLQVDEISVFPNPSNNSFILKTLELTHFDVYDAKGQLIESIDVKDEISFGKNYKPGVYLLKSPKDTNLLKIVKK